MCINKLRQSSANIFPLGIPKLSDKYILWLSVSILVLSDIDKKIYFRTNHHFFFFFSRYSILQKLKSFHRLLNQRKKFFFLPNFEEINTQRQPRFPFSKEKKILPLHFQVSIPRKKEGGESSSKRFLYRIPCSQNWESRRRGDPSSKTRINLRRGSQRDSLDRIFYFEWSER